MSAIGQLATSGAKYENMGRAVRLVADNGPKTGDQGASAVGNCPDRDRAERVAYCCSRLKDGKTKYSLAKQSGVAMKTLNNFIYGYDTRCSIIKRIADSVGVSAGWLAFGEGTPQATGHTLTLKSDEYAPIGELSPRGTNDARSPWAVWKRDARIDCLPLATEGDLFAFRVSETNLEPRFLEGDWVFIDQRETEIDNSGAYCIDLNGRIVIREVVFRDDGTVLVSQPGYGLIPPDVRTFKHDDFRKLVRICGRIVATLRPAELLRQPSTGYYYNRRGQWWLHQ